MAVCFAETTSTCGLVDLDVISDRFLDRNPLGPADSGISTAQGIGVGPLGVTVGREAHAARSTEGNYRSRIIASCSLA